MRGQIFLKNKWDRPTYRWSWPYVPAVSAEAAASIQIESPEEECIPTPQLRDTPAQTRIKGEIESLQTQIIKIGELKSLGFATAENKKQLVANKKLLKVNEQKVCCIEGAEISKWRCQ